ncbi:hypothetical protein [Streptomyces albireticuli]|uniref:Uncharacterized protein n=1 Tax=Streptomyces albireticuli TaxID=1940 RepID=A0A2A2D345_9ACTN|nr:hypothetical protein [Streptomyces albireticuli]MCD9145978.1 hypothetical protein [Streptomyces albireticuli]MCD9165779.1 hypothetical protein [Streptomyces albireticuli]MCD9195997.1 hypothetical protein [Streptomyces albireticuli]PAU46908.1 hypothetical protein CK936_21665 [Streptomyces albireticuli]
MAFLRCEVVRWVDDEPQPGLVEARFTDAHQREWAFIDKCPVFTGDNLTSDSLYPVVVGVLCDVLTTDGTGNTVTISVARWGLESLEGDIEFEVRADQLTTS